MTSSARTLVPEIAMDRPRPHHAAIAVLLGIHFVLQLFLIVPIALVVFPLALIAGMGAHSREHRVMSLPEPPGNQKPRRRP